MNHGILTHYHPYLGIDPSLPQSGFSKCGSAVFLFAISYETTFGSRDDGVPFLLPGHSLLPCHLAKFPNANEPMQRPSAPPIDTHYYYRLSSANIAILRSLVHITRMEQSRSTRWIKIEKRTNNLRLRMEAADRRRAERATGPKHRLRVLVLLLRFQVNPTNRLLIGM